MVLSSNHSETPQAPFAVAPPPWQCKCDAYWLVYYQGQPLPEHAYAPLEAESPNFSDPVKVGQFRGGSAMVQVIRYHETPVGPYDELIFCPGYFDVPPDEDGKKRAMNLRITRIYVSQKDTTWNGRRNWNIPKHLARFSFERLTSPVRLNVKVFPPDPSIETPFFTATLQPFTWVPAIPFSTRASGYVGLDVTLTQPPLPSSDKKGEEELCGSEKWLRVLPLVGCAKTKGCWVDAQTPNEAVGGWWPQVKPYKIGLWMEDAYVIFGEADVLSVSQS